MGFSAFGWTWKCTITTAYLSVAVSPVAMISAFWFPPPSFSGGVLLRLAARHRCGGPFVGLLAALIMRRSASVSRETSRLRIARGRLVSPTTSSRIGTGRRVRRAAIGLVFAGADLSLSSHWIGSSDGTSPRSPFS